MVVKRAIDALDGDKWKLLIFNTFYSIVILTPVCLVLGELQSFVYDEYFFDFDIQLLLIVTGVVGFLINIAIYLQISLTNPVTSTISATAKACVQTLVAYLFWRNPISFLVKKTFFFFS